MLLRSGRTAWGALILFRADDLPDFSPGEMAFLQSVSAPLAGGIRRGLVANQLDMEPDPVGPGLMLLHGGDDLRVETTTPAATNWLHEIADGIVATNGLPYAVYSLAHRTRQGRSARLRLRTRSGRWLTLHTSALDGDRVAVIIEPSNPLEMAALIVDAFGLTRREQEVTRLVLHGHSTAEIAQLLVVSPYTVQDHLKKIFDKLQVGSRAELTSKLFFNQYLPRIKAGFPAGADGWFLDSQV